MRWRGTLGKLINNIVPASLRILKWKRPHFRMTKKWWTLITMIRWLDAQLKKK